jgi:hypothetical protein
MSSLSLFRDLGRTGIGLKAMNNNVPVSQNGFRENLVKYWWCGWDQFQMEMLQLSNRRR